MQRPLTTNEIFAADRKVGIVIGAIGVAISAYFVATLIFLIQYHQAFYSAAR